MNKSLFEIVGMDSVKMMAEISFVGLGYLVTILGSYIPGNTFFDDTNSHSTLFAEL